MQQPPGGWGPAGGYPPPGYGQGYGPPQHQGPTYQPIYVQTPVWACPFCRASTPPQDRYNVSGGGWVVFFLLLLFCFPLCWLGLLIKDHHRVCGHCGTRLG
jgi:lipopolysaccharide-induced tumor necrosis factor-alpha factor